MRLGLDRLRRLRRSRVSRATSTDREEVSQAPLPLADELKGLPHPTAQQAPSDDARVGKSTVDKTARSSTQLPATRMEGTELQRIAKPDAAPSLRDGRGSSDVLDVEDLHRAPPRFSRIPRRHGEDPESVSNDSYGLLDSLRDKVGGMLLLTATPMQLHDFELYSMVELVEPGLFSGYGDFSSSRMEIAGINGAVAALRSSHPPADAIEECLHILRHYNAPANLLELASGGRGERETAAIWLSRCHRLSHALVRNRKAEIGGFTKRIAHRIDVIPSEEEVALERDLQKYIRERYERAAKGKQSAVGLVLVTFQKMLCSSTRAVAGALESRADRLTRQADAEEVPLADDPDLAAEQHALRELPSTNAPGEAEELRRLASRARRIEDSKLTALEGLVERILARDENEKVLIFSQFLGSIEMIRSRLAERHAVRTFHGQMSRQEKDQAHQAFRHGTRILVSSEAGGEGRNFQFCHVVVNYDLPWNPMKIEQRIGRIDRVGQDHDVEIFNFAVRGMLDARILDVLEHRIRVFTETVGALDAILESLEEEFGRITLGEKGDADAGFASLDADLDEQLRDAQELENMRRDFVLDWRSLQREKASLALGRTPRATRQDLERFFRTAIGRFEGAGLIEPHPDGGLFVKVPGMLRKARKDVDEDYRGTFDVHQALRDERLDFFAMGHPLVESILDNAGDPWWLPVTALESEEWASSDPALLVDYRLELYGIRDNGELLSHLVSSDGVKPPISVRQPEDPALGIHIPALPRRVVEEFAVMSSSAARQEAIQRFDTFKEEHAGVAEQEIERLTRMFNSRRGFIDDRIARNERQVEHLERSGTVSQQRIIPARQGQIRADRKRLAELEEERARRLREVHDMVPSYFLRLLGVALIVRRGGLQELVVE